MTNAKSITELLDLEQVWISDSFTSSKLLDFNHEISEFVFFELVIDEFHQL